MDVREPDEWEAGHIPGAALIPRSLFEYQAAEKHPDEESRFVVAAPAEPWRSGGEDSPGDGLHERRQHGRRRKRLEGDGLRDSVDS